MPNSATYLLQKQLPINPDRRLLIFPTILPQATRNITHALQAIPAIQQVLNVLRHHLGHILELVVQLVQILRRPRVLVRLLGALDERVELDEGVGPTRRRQVLLRLVGLREFRGQVREVGEGEFARVGAVADAEEAEVVADEVAGMALVWGAGLGAVWGMHW
jgi:hypothetical protein